MHPFSPFQLNSATAVLMLLAVLWMCKALTSEKWVTLEELPLEMLICCSIPSPSRALLSDCPEGGRCKLQWILLEIQGKYSTVKQERFSQFKSMNLPYVLWVYKIALLALIKLSRLQHTWLFAICAIHLCTFWRGVEVFTKGFTYYQQWQLHWKLSIITYRFSSAFNFLIFSWGFFMPEAWVWEWEGANISVTELSYWKETLLCPNQNIFLNKLTCSENNNSMVHSRFRPTNT